MRHDCTASLVEETLRMFDDEGNARNDVVVPKGDLARERPIDVTHWIYSDVKE